jgi:hypothetical protein
MKDFIQFLVTSLVKNPQNVSVEESGEGSNFKYLIAVDPADMGLVIGKEGRTINSIRSLAKAKAVKENVWIDVELIDYGRQAMSDNATNTESTPTSDQAQEDDQVKNNLTEAEDSSDPTSNNA